MTDALDHPLEPPHEVRFEVMHMRWLNLTFLHWQFDPEQVQAILPHGLTQARAWWMAGEWAVLSLRR